MLQIRSLGRSLAIDPQEPTKIIGERINPTGKPAVQARLKKGDFGFVSEMAAEQQAAGAHIMGVNVGLPGADEPALLVQAVDRAAQATDLPLYIDSSNQEALLAAWQAYLGTPLLGSCTGEEKSYRPLMEQLVQRPPGLVVMAHDERGINLPIEQRLEVVERVCAAAEHIGFPIENLVFDCLAMSVGADPEAAKSCLACIRELASRGRATIIGLSNISFGLPRRPAFNAAFAAMASQAGLAAAIMNPNSPGTVEALMAADALSGRDQYAMAFLEYHRARGA